MMARSDVLVQELVKGRIFCWSRIICVVEHRDIFKKHMSGDASESECLRSKVLP